MGSKTILSDREDIKNIEAEEQINFVFSVLQASGVSEDKLEACLTEEILSVKNKIIFRKLCEKEQISIVDNLDGSLKIYMKAEHQDVLVAEWFQPSYTIRIDNSVIDRSKRMFVEILFRWWTVFEDDDEKK